MFASRLLKLAILALCIIYVADAARVDDIQVVRRDLEVRQTPGSDNTKAADPAPTKGSEASAPSPSDNKDDSKATSAAAESKPADTKETASPADSSPASPAKTTAAAPNDNKDKTTAAAPQETKATASSSKGDANKDKATSEASKADDAKQTAAPSSSAAPKDDNSKSKDNSDKNSDASLRPVTSTHIDVVTMTNDDGTKSTMTTTTRTTSTPGLNSGDNGGDSSSMPVKTRNIVIGVVVGIGGSIVLGALALVAWRIWGRKKHAEEADGLMAFGGDNDTSYQGSSARYPSGGSYPGGYAGVEKSETPSTGGGSIGPARSPFQNNEAFHAPAQGQVNASSNF